MCSRPTSREGAGGANGELMMRLEMEGEHERWNRVTCIGSYNVLDMIRNCRDSIVDVQIDSSVNNQSKILTINIVSM